MMRNNLTFAPALCAMLCATTVSCSDDAPDAAAGAQWLRGEACSAIAPYWREGFGVVDGHSPTIDLNLRGGRIRIDESGKAGASGWRERLRLMKTIDPKPILRLTISDRTSCTQTSAVLKDVTETYGCTRLHCAIVEGTGHD